MASHVLVVPKGFFGDMLLTTPVLEALKSGANPPRISVLCPPSMRSLVSQDPLVDEVLTFDRKGEHRGWKGLQLLARLLREKRFERVYCFQRSPRTSILMWLARIRERVAYSDAWLSVLYTRRVRRTQKAHEVIRNLELIYNELDGATQCSVDHLRASLGQERGGFASLRMAVPSDEHLTPAVIEVLADQSPYVVLSPGSAWETKQWSPRGFRFVAEQLSSRGLRVLIVGAPHDSHACAAASEGLLGSGVINLCGKTSVLDTVRLIDGAKVVVCNDSLALHLASAVQTPAVVVFCSTSPRFGFGPWKNRAIIVEKRDLFCKPCRRHGSRRCPTGTRACMVGVSGAEVFHHVEELLAEQGVSFQNGLV